MELSHQQFADLLQRFESTPEPEEVRRSARIVIRRRATIVLDPDSNPKEVDVVLQDISRGGVCITHHEGMPRDKKFRLILPGSDGRAVAMDCVVRHCTMIKQHLFRIGGQFQNHD